MRAKLTFLRALVVGTLSGVLTSACQTYDFEPVEPIAISQTTETRTIKARASKPNLMLLVDTSGSMTAPVNPALAGCKIGTVVCGADDDHPCDTTKCPTRWSDLQDAMSSFLTESGTIARIGLATYPDPKASDVNKCGPATSLKVALPPPTGEDEATLKKNADEVKAKLLAIKNSSNDPNVVTPTGGTPTSESLKYLAKLGDLQGEDRADFVVLLTDGLPNCNYDYPSPSPSQDCFCILSSCSSEFGLERAGCLDTEPSVAAVRALRSETKERDIQTIVIGFGTDFKAGTESGRRGAATLNGMAMAGGFTRECTTNADCGADDTCTAGVCNRRFFQAENKTQLSEALRKIAEKVIAEAPCELRIDPAERPTSEELMVVFLNGERLSPGPDTWVMKDPGIVFQGSTCARIEASSPSAPANIEVRAVQRR